MEKMEAMQRYDRIVNRCGWKWWGHSRGSQSRGSVNEDSVIGDRRRIEWEN